jgi:hypothetical protein
LTPFLGRIFNRKGEEGDEEKSGACHSFCSWGPMLFCQAETAISTNFFIL